MVVHEDIIKQGSIETDENGNITVPVCINYDPKKVVGEITLNEEGTKPFTGELFTFTIFPSYICKEYEFDEDDKKKHIFRRIITKCEIRNFGIIPYTGQENQIEPVATQNLPVRDNFYNKVKDDYYQNVNMSGLMRSIKLYEKLGKDIDSGIIYEHKEEIDKRFEELHNSMYENYRQLEDYFKWVEAQKEKE